MNNRQKLKKMKRELTYLRNMYKMSNNIFHWDCSKGHIKTYTSICSAIDDFNLDRPALFNCLNRKLIDELSKGRAIIYEKDDYGYITTYKATIKVIEE